MTKCKCIDGVSPTELLSGILDAKGLEDTSGAISWSCHLLAHRWLQTSCTHLTHHKGPGQTGSVPLWDLARANTVILACCPWVGLESKGRSFCCRSFTSLLISHVTMIIKTYYTSWDQNPSFPLSTLTLPSSPECVWVSLVTRTK